MDFLQSYGMILIILAAAVGFVMAWGIGANDVANAMGTSVGSKALTIKQAIIIAMIFEFAGAYLAGGEVTSTIRKGIIDTSYFVDIPEYLVLGMISSLFAAGLWLAVASYLGWPVSTTHSIVGAIIGFTAVGVSMDAVEWSKVGGIVGSWIVTPAISGVIAYLIFMSAHKLIFETDKPFHYARKYVPFYMAFAGFLTFTTGEMSRSGEDMEDWLEILWALRSLERIGDRCKNICEYIVSLTSGKDVRHTPLESLQQKLDDLT